jgi:uncharacterized protein (TIGR00251 family)
MSISCVRQNDKDVFISVKIRAGARTTGIRKIHGEALCIDLQEPPEQGKANKALLRFLADLFGKRLSDVEVIEGAFSRNKLIRIINSSSFDIEHEIHAVLRSLSS